MEKAKLFQYAAIWHPTQEQAEKGQKAKLVVDITTIASINEQSVNMTACRAIPVEYNGQLQQIEVLVRSFH